MDLRKCPTRQRDVAWLLACEPVVLPLESERVCVEGGHFPIVQIQQLLYMVAEACLQCSLEAEGA
jgi:hypothetical protein